MTATRQVARVPIATPAGEFDVLAFECPSGLTQLAMIKGDIGDGRSVLARIHSECLTGDALGSLRCDCGVQLRVAMRRIAAEGRGVLLYATGHEGRGIGLTNKLLAYMLQDGGLDTVDANLELRLPVDGRDYRESADVLRLCGVRSVRLLTNNPEKVRGLVAAGLAVDEVLPIRTAAHVRNVSYLATKKRRLGHLSPGGEDLGNAIEPAADGGASAADAVDVTALLGPVRPRPERPYVVLKYAQTLDGRIATATGDSKWITGEPERRIAHAMRAACDAVLVGAGTVERDDPQLTVRMVPGASPIRVVLDSTLRLSATAKVLRGDASTVVITSPRSDPARRLSLQASAVGVRVVPSGPRGVDLAEALRVLREIGITALLVEGGARVITSLLEARAVDRLVVAIAPVVLGRGTDSVGDLGITRIAHALPLGGRIVHHAGEDLVVAGDLLGAGDLFAAVADAGERAGAVVERGAAVGPGALAGRRSTGW